MDRPHENPRCRVLLVEDEVQTARLLARMLREDGYDVELVLDGAAAINRLTRAPMPDVIVTDFKLPHADGLVVAAYARSRDEHVPIMLITSYPELVRERNAALDPPLVVLSKPLAYTELTRELDRCHAA